MLDFFGIETSLLFRWNKVVCTTNSTLRKRAGSMKNEMQNKYMYAYPDGKKTYTDENVITSVKSSLSRCPFCNEIYIRFAFDKEKMMFYPWISVSDNQLQDSYLEVILLPAFSLQELDFSRKETLRMKRLLQRTFPAIRVRSSLRIHPDDMDYVLRKQRSRKNSLKKKK